MENQVDSQAGDGWAGPSTARQPERAPSRAERRGETARMVTVLSEALAAQIGRLAAAADPAPDGWWFSPGPRH